MESSGNSATRLQVRKQALGVSEVATPAFKALQGAELNEPPIG